MTELLSELVPSLQKLVDARLDNIDRALLSTDVSRYERRQIVSAVEDQIQELVARIDREEPSREDILRILASLDPPEAYGNGSMQNALEQQEHAKTNRRPGFQFAASIRPKANTLSIVSIVLGALSLIAIPSTILLGFLAFFLSVTCSIAAMICGVIALCQLMLTKGREFGIGMSIAGIASLPFAIFGIALFYIALM